MRVDGLVDALHEIPLAVRTRPIGGATIAANLAKLAPDSWFLEFCTFRFRQYEHAMDALLGRLRTTMSGDVDWPCKQTPERIALHLQHPGSVAAYKRRATCPGATRNQEWQIYPAERIASSLESGRARARVTEAPPGWFETCWRAPTICWTVKKFSQVFRSEMHPKSTVACHAHRS
jgi:hypothetical protein